MIRRLSAVLILLGIMASKVKPVNDDFKHRDDTIPGQLKNDWIADRIDSTMRANNIPGLALAVVDGDDLRFSGFGTLERGKSCEIDEHSIFQIASDTKKFTAIIVRNLEAEGKLNLNTPISQYLTDSISEEARRSFSNVTLKLLLLHRAGIPNRAPGNKRIDGSAMLIEYTEENLLADLNRIQPEFTPDSRMAYSNFGYAIVGYICEIVSGKKYHELLKYYITDYYRMQNTFVYPSAEQLTIIAQPYRKDDRMVKSYPWKMGKITPAGGIYSNASDLSTLMMAQIKAYQMNSETGDTKNPLLLTENDGIQGSHYGFGLSKNIEDNWSRYGHGGDLDGYASEYVFSPEKNIGLIMLTTSGGKWFGDLSKEIKDYLFEKKSN